jgi:hypothetical protein
MPTVIDVSAPSALAVVVTPSDYSYPRKDMVMELLAKKAVAEEQALLERVVLASVKKRDEALGHPSICFDPTFFNEAAMSQVEWQLYRKVLDEFQRHAEKPYRTKSVGVMSIAERIQGGKLSILPNRYLPHIGDNYGLFFRFLLAIMPLDRADKVYGNMDPIRFHHDYMLQWYKVLGDSPSLPELRLYAHSFLTKKCWPGKVKNAIANPGKAFNEFKWTGFYMYPTEITEVVDRTIYLYGLARSKATLVK